MAIAAAAPAPAALITGARGSTAFPATHTPEALECPRFGGHLSTWSVLSGQAGRMSGHAKGIELPEAVPAGVPA